MSNLTQKTAAKILVVKIKRVSISKKGRLGGQCLPLLLWHLNLLLNNFGFPLVKF